MISKLIIILRKKSMVKIIKSTLAMRHYRFVFASVTFLFSTNLGLLENFISLNDLLRENRVYYFKENKDPVNGPVKTFWSNGYVENTGTLSNGLKEKDWEYFHDNGKLRAKGSYIKGKKSGRWLTYYNNGNMRSEEVYDGGKKSGVWAFYYRSGNIRTEEEYKDNNLEGIWKFYLESGELMESGFQKNGLRDGFLEIFDKSGDLVKKETWAMGVLKNVELY